MIYLVNHSNFVLFYRIFHHENKNKNKFLFLFWRWNIWQNKTKLLWFQKNNQSIHVTHNLRRNENLFPWVHAVGQWQSSWGNLCRLGKIMSQERHVQTDYWDLRKPNWYISTHILPRIARAMLVKIHVQLNQFTRIAVTTHLNMSSFHSEIAAFITTHLLDIIYWIDSTLESSDIIISARLDPERYHAKSNRY